MFWAGSPDASYAVISAAAMMAAAMEAPATAIVFMVELTSNIDAAMVPMLVAVVGATLVARRFNLRSIYSSRLSPELPHREDPGKPRINSEGIPFN